MGSALGQLQAHVSLSATDLPYDVSQLEVPKSKLKRTAEDTLLSPRSKCRRLSTSNYSAAAWSASRTTIQPPDPSSINGLMRKHGRNRQATPTKATAPMTKQYESSADMTKPSVRRQMICFARARPSLRLRQLDNSSKTTASIAWSKCPRYLVMYPANGNSLFSLDLPFHFDRHVVATLRTNGVFSCSSTGSAAPILAYLDLGTVRSYRNMSIKLSTWTGFNPPIARLRQKM
ncbi:hypothetical protein IL306_009437 [Fusarium sp. DS 682]|nr:hypothetical protein IL306_009437 [Fusarium sp. DS 682]